MSVKLTKSEMAVYELKMKGYSNYEIGEKLFISELTVKKHCTNIFKKFEVKNRIELRQTSRRPVLAAVGEGGFSNAGESTRKRSTS